MAPPKPRASSAKTKSSSKSTKVFGSKSRVSKDRPKAPPPKQQKTRPTLVDKKKKRRVYTEEELGLPKLNMITPVGVQKPKGKKKGKVFVDDAESMMTILAIVNAEKEGQIESKMMKARQMEEIREARQKEMEKRQELKKGRLEGVKDELRKKRNNKSSQEPANVTEKQQGKRGKRVSFG